jgi:hypothetical protein
MGITRPMARPDDRERERDLMSPADASTVAPLEDLSTDEVLRQGQVQLDSSREVLNLLDDALRKGADIISPGPAVRDDDVIVLEERRARDGMSPQNSWRR